MQAWRLHPVCIMSTHRHTTTVRAALAAALLTALPAAHAQMYRWTDAQGSVTYSNELPHDTRVVQDLTVVLENPDGSKPNLPPPVSEPRRPTVGEVVDDFQHGGESDEPPRASPRIAVSPGGPDAVRDPCLRSSDPKCIERNKAAYVPGHGYTPGTAIGATTGAGGGTLAGVSPPPSQFKPPKASAYALPPGTELPPLASKR